MPRKLCGKQLDALGNLLHDPSTRYCPERQSNYLDRLKGRK